MFDKDDTKKVQDPGSSITINGKEFHYDKVKQANARQKPPLYSTDSKYSRSQKLFFCHNDGDTAFELLENGKETGKCCRCGENF